VNVPRNGGLVGGRQEIVVDQRLRAFAQRVGIEASLCDADNFPAFGHLLRQAHADRRSARGVLLVRIAAASLDR
jgi:hypothetical protein